MPLLLLVMAAPAISAKTPPNFIIVYADDLGYADTSVQMMDADPSTKHKFIQTPGLDRLAEIGGRFTAAYSPTPTCTGSRMSIQLGKSSAAVQYRNVNDVLAKHTGQPVDVVARDTERDNIMSAEDAKAYGLVDEIIDANYKPEPV